MAMMVVVTYDVNTETLEGRRRLRRVADCCQDYGQRVQYSVFECLVDPTQWAVLKARLLTEVNSAQDSLRFYYIGGKWRTRIEHVGAKPVKDPEGPLIV